MRFPLRSILLTSFLFLITFLVVGQTLVLNRGLREELIQVRERELEGELELASVFLESLGPVSHDSAARAFAGRIGYPVTFLNLYGSVVGASSDLLIVDVTDATTKYTLGDEMGFLLSYPGILSATTSKYIHINCH